VKILYHGTLKGILSPIKSRSELNVKDHPFFGMHKDAHEDVEEMMNQLRGDRYHDI
jgi:hypothetical protein